MPRAQTFTPKELKAIERQEAYFEKLMSKLETSIRKEEGKGRKGEKGGKEGISTPTLDPTVSAGPGRKIACYSLPETTIVSVGEITEELRRHVYGRVSKSAVVDYLLQTAPKISPREFVAKSMVRRRGRGVPYNQLRPIPVSAGSSVDLSKVPWNSRKGGDR
jgi:hypothetical protein